MSPLKRFARDRGGSVSLEYALLVFFVGCPVIIVMSAIRLGIQEAYNSLDGSLSWSGSLL